MYIRIDLLNPRNVAFSETFPSSTAAIVFRIEDNQVHLHSNGDWTPVYTSKSTISTFYRVAELMTKVMAMHAENLLREQAGESPAYPGDAYDQIIEQMQVLIAAK